MAQRVKRALAALLALSVLPAGAEGLPDPTRPPVGIDEAGPAASAPSMPRLQMIKISPTHRIAIVDGEEVTIGSRLGDLRVVAITENEVVLRGKSERETLKLFVDVEKRPRAAGTANKPLNTQAGRAPAARPTKKETSRKAQP